MWRKVAFLLICITCLSLETWAGAGVCAFYGDVYRDQIKPKIQSGVPFELMSAVFEDSHLVDKKAIRVVYNLWDEVVTLKSGDAELTRFPFAKGETELCKFLEVESHLEVGRKYVFKILLNPMWAERITRLQLNSDQGGGSMIDWRKLAGEMPSEKVLLEKELSP